MTNTSNTETMWSAQPDNPAAANDEMISKLNGLIATCRDGQEGFKQAAEGIENADLKPLFYEISRQRATFVGELQDLVRTLGGDPENAGSVTGAFHRGWINLRATVSGGDEVAVLSECERGEDVAKAEYEKVLEGALPAYIQQTLQQQYGTVLAAHDRIKSLRDTARGERSSTAGIGF
ncbi:MAG TPA: PA2169 family four-helix-bundle protein [Pyrinomonadaceae bacterium]|nr:PA2169 family four-helix-bundle protein [Pyrinomonadaceae bacterium]